MNNNLKTISLEEFIERGYLQEVNRQFFHPLGLALSIVVTDKGPYTFGEIWDYRSDPEGISFHPSMIDNNMRENAKNVEQEQALLAESRKVLLGYVVQPL